MSTLNVVYSNNYLLMLSYRRSWLYFKITIPELLFSFDAGLKSLIFLFLFHTSRRSILGETTLFFLSIQKSTSWKFVHKGWRKIDYNIIVQLIEMDEWLEFELTALWKFYCKRNSFPRGIVLMIKFVLKRFEYECP